MAPAGDMAIRMLFRLTLALLVGMAQRAAAEPPPAAGVPPPERAPRQEAPTGEGRRPGVHGHVHTLDPTRWPAEPAGPAHVEPARLAAALEQACPPIVPSARLQAIASYTVEEAERFGVDPLLLGALVVTRSACHGARRHPEGVGLTLLNRRALPGGLTRGELRYALPGPTGIEELRRLSFSPPLSAQRGALLDERTNLRVAAALLRVSAERCPAIDAVFHSAPHRHHVSHFVFGDRVRSAAPEDAILTMRRRLLQYYGAAQLPTVRLRSLTLGSPLDGPPRIVTSGLGEAREGGRRAHAGVDFLSEVGEPVRAIADGVVRRAGTDLLDGSLIDLAPERAALVPERAMGVRGLFVEIEHAEGVRSIYAHLASFTAVVGAPVRRGQLIGYVGRSGIRESHPHLHFGLFQGAQVLDPRRVLAGLLFAPLLELREAEARISPAVTAR